MLKLIVVKDFQRHLARTVELSPTVTTFVGESDAGKSAIAYRAILWVATNQPTGNAMIRWGTSRALAKLAFDDCEVVRKKGEGVNLYLLDGSRRKAFGAGKVPDDVAAALRLDPINFQGQQDPAFWISDTPGKVSQELNRVVDLGVIDSSLASAESDLRKARASREVCEERLARAQSAAKDLAWVPAMSADLDRINSLEEELGTVRTEQSALSSLVEGLEETQNKAQEASGRAEAAQGVVEAAKEAWRASQERESLASLLEDLTECEARAAMEVPDLGPMKAMSEALVVVRDEIASLESLLEDLEQMEEEVCRRESTATKAANALGKVKACPVCKRPLTRS